MSTEVKQAKGRLWWLIPIFEFIIIIAYFAIGWGGIAHAVKHMDFVGIFESVKTAVIFLIVAIAVITVLCFLPLFRSRGNVYCAIWNIVWIAFTIYELF
ncbi:MAG: hypothetical protein IJU35_07450 [Paludibacteraceae bacterium]|nr:hypothetical protein [Paludibacteraceae bacterium]